MIAALLLTALTSDQMPEGVTVKNLFLNDKRIARSIEVRKMVVARGTPMRYYTSRTRSFLPGQTLADIESWSLLDGKPIKAIYSFGNVKLTADFQDGEVVFTKQIGGKRVVTKVQAPEDKPVLLSQFDPLSLTRTMKDGTIKCAVVVPETQEIVDCTLVDEGAATIRQGLEERKGTRFAFEGLKGKSWITLDSDGSFVSYRSEAGLEARVDRWRKEDEDVFDLSAEQAFGVSSSWKG
jgi:hypothetical protein